MEDLLAVRPVAQGRLSEGRPGVPDCPEETVTLLRPLRGGVTLTADDFTYFCFCALEGRSPPPDLPLPEKHSPGLNALLPPPSSPQKVLGPGKSPVHNCFHRGCHGGQLKIVEMTVNSC